MKHFTIIMTAVLFALLSNAQTAEQDSVEMGAGYANEVFYKLNDGAKNAVDRANWDLAFDVSGFGTAIRINGAAGTELWQYPNGDTADWASVDTAGIGSWTQAYDSEETWFYGAFDIPSTSDWRDIGWGMYNDQNHQIIGNKLFIIKLSDGSYQKVWVESMISGAYTIRHASLDGVMDMTHTVTKANFAGKNLGYFSLQNHTEVDREPLATDWDFVVTRYVADYNGPMSTVGGVLLNSGVYAAEARGLPANEVNHFDYTSDSLINTIGWDWKDINYQNFQWELEDSLSYFISDVEGNIWQVEFTGFAGTSSGKVWFNKTLISATVINDVET